MLQGHHGIGGGLGLGCVPIGGVLALPSRECGARWSTRGHGYGSRIMEDKALVLPSFFGENCSTYGDQNRRVSVADHFSGMWVLASTHLTTVAGP